MKITALDRFLIRYILPFLVHYIAYSLLVFFIITTVILESKNKKLERENEQLQKELYLINDANCVL